LPVLFPGKGNDKASYIQSTPPLLANLNCVILDYLARQKVHGNHLAWYLLEQIPVVAPRDYARLFGSKTALEIVREAVLELTYTADDIAPFARDMGLVDRNGEILPPFEWDEERRLKLRAKLDALYFILYGVLTPPTQRKVGTTSVTSIPTATCAALKTFEALATMRSFAEAVMAEDQCMPLRVKAARRRTSLTQGDVASIIGQFKKGHISRMENGCRWLHPRFHTRRSYGRAILITRSVDRTGK
jgi:hypothetical protein